MYGAMKIICTMPKAAPITAPSMVTPSATPPRPRRVMGNPSRQVTAWGRWHGRFSRIEEVAADFVIAHRSSSIIRRTATVEEVANMAGVG